METTELLYVNNADHEFNPQISLSGFRCNPRKVLSIETHTVWVCMVNPLTTSAAIRLSRNAYQMHSEWFHPIQSNLNAQIIPEINWHGSNTFIISENRK